MELNSPVGRLRRNPVDGRHQRKIPDWVGNFLVKLRYMVNP